MTDTHRIDALIVYHAAVIARLAREGYMGTVELPEEAYQRIKQRLWDDLVNGVIPLELP